MSSATNYISTRGATGGLKTALLQGLAPDAGLYLPKTIPQISESQWKQWRGLSFCDLATKLAPLWFGNEVDAELLQTITREAYTFDIPFHDLTNHQYCCELFHGPSLSFKDVAAQFLMRLLDVILERDNEQAIVLTATSGDTGSAVAAACHGRKRIRAVILYPRGRVSRVQEQQIATWGSNVHAIAVSGTFDDCQRLVKARLIQPAPKGCHLTSANSINIGRLLPQTFYYWHVSIHHPDSVIVVPTGNIGNLTAGILAQRMGAPIHHFVAATNANDSLPRFLQSGRYDPHATIHTLSNAMDVGDPSNFERLNLLFRNSVDSMRKMITAVKVSEDETRAAIADVCKRHHYLTDPHTAVAWQALNCTAPQFKGHPMIALSTAHPAKFPEIVLECTGQDPPIPASLQTQLRRLLLVTPLPNATNEAFEAILEAVL